MKPKKKLQMSDISRYIRSTNARAIGIVILTCVLLIALFSITIAPKRYNLTVGEVPDVTISATKDVVDEIATEEAREKARNSVSVPYLLQTDVIDQVLADYDAIFSELAQAREAVSASGITMSASPDELNMVRSYITRVDLNDLQLRTLISATQDNFNVMYTQVRNIIESVYLDTENAIQPGQEKNTVNSIIRSARGPVTSSLLTNIVEPVLTQIIRANLITDQEEYLAKQNEAYNTVNLVIYKQGANIVEKGGHPVTENQIRMLESLGLLTGSGIDVLLYVGGALIIILLMTASCLLIKKTTEDVTNHLSAVLIICITMVLTYALCILARMLNVYLAPVMLAAMLLTALINLNCGIVANVALSIMVATLAAGGSDVYAEEMALSLVCNILCGTVACMMMKGRTTRLHALICMPVTMLIDLIIMIAYAMMTSDNVMSNLSTVGWQCAGIAISTLLFIALQPLFEALFNLPTPSKLMELSNPSHPLLRRLLTEAPGTYHHSILVANLAEACAEEVGANALLARVAGYYHDVGKLKRPLFFKENQMGEENAHDHTDPQVSAAILTAHPGDGVAIAKSYRLPKAILQIIGSHHGNTPVMYFYYKALQQANGKNVDIDNFRYNAEPPTTKEGAIVLLCDTIEAAVRSMKNPTPQGIEDFIVKLVRGKLEDGQLSHCDLTLKDIDAICDTCVKVLCGVFHERIEYPDVDKSKRPGHRTAEVQAKEAAANTAAQKSEEKQDDTEKKPAEEAAPVPGSDKAEKAVKKEEKPAESKDSREDKAVPAPEAENKEAPSQKEAPEKKEVPEKKDAPAVESKPACKGATEKPEAAAEVKPEPKAEPAPVVSAEKPEAAPVPEAADKADTEEQENKEEAVSAPVTAETQETATEETTEAAAGPAAEAEHASQPEAPASEPADEDDDGDEEEAPVEDAPVMTKEEIAQAVEKLEEEMSESRTENALKNQTEEAIKAEHFGVQKTASAADGIVFVTPQNAAAVQTVDVESPAVGPLVLDDILNGMSTKGKLESAPKEE